MTNPSPAASFIQSHAMTLASGLTKRPMTADDDRRSR